jgi:hypothetical protein
MDVPLVPLTNEVIERPCVPTQRTRDVAGRNEVFDIKEIVRQINARTPAGLKICEAFKAAFVDDEILEARERKGNRGIHYDFEVRVASDPTNWHGVEHKGSQKVAPIPDDQTPWAAGVQFHNGGCEKYSIAKLYAQAWYATHIGSGTLKAEFGVEAAIPTFDEWFAGDAKCQGDPKTPFGKELKRKVKERCGKEGLLEKRAAAHAAFVPTAADMETFKAESLAILNVCLEQKKYWLTIQGPLTAEFHCKWYPKFTIASITAIRIRVEKDIWFDFECEGCRFSSILRWGKGAGFSNLRIDAR